MNYGPWDIRGYLKDENSHFYGYTTKFIFYSSILFFFRGDFIIKMD